MIFSAEVRKKLENYRIHDFIANHSNVESDLSKSRNLIMKYSLASDISISHRIFLNQLELFEFDLNLHSRIEDEIVIPKAKALEAILIQMI